ncbi:cell wall-binding repeat-containing protein [Lagierella massiliensis]|uniref:cell wall-binding repeat-containing protein n=1 Tax=Lagierella massiliensis TaxID=1689303 RepID=UPI0006D79CEA|nr:cell wall-binding repeat-containing protein [Lagierella massiliensis]
MNKKFLAVLLAGSMLIPAGKLNASQNLQVERIYGTNRYETATKISEKYYDKSKAVVVASGEVFPDALVGSTLTIQEKWPLLLTGSKKLDEHTKKELERIKPEKVYILGGDSTVSVDVEREISKSYPVERISGTNRYKTSEKLGQVRYKLLGKEIAKENITNYVADGEKYPDALAAGPLAGRNKENKFNLLNLAPSTKGFDNAVIIGGKDSVEGKEKRISGSNRYLTSLEVAKEYKKEFGGLDTVIIASGEDYPDALSASSVAAKLNAPIVLATKDGINEKVLSFVKENAKKIVIVGGDSSIAEDNLVNIMYGKNSLFSYTVNKMPKDLKDVSKRHALTGNEKLDIINLFNEGNNLSELTRVITKEQALKVLGLEAGEYDEAILKAVAAYKLGSNVEAETLREFIKGNELKPVIDKMLKGLVANNNIKAMKSGDISNPYVAFELGKEYDKAKVLTNNDAFRAGVELITKNEATGFNIISKEYANNFDKSKTFVYSQDSIDNVNQLLAILRMEGIKGKVAIEPKSSAYEYRKEWGEPAPATEKYEVVKVKDGKMVANSIEFNIYIEFENKEDMQKLDKLVIANTMKTKDMPNGENRIADSWWVPLYSTTAEMGEGYGNLIDNKIVKDDLILHTFTLEKDSAKVIKTLNEFLKVNTAVAEKIWVNNPFIDYIKGE